MFRYIVFLAATMTKNNLQTDLGLMYLLGKKVISRPIFKRTQNIKGNHTVFEAYPLIFKV